VQVPYKGKPFCGINAKAAKAGTPEDTITITGTTDAEGMAALNLDPHGSRVI
jgi:hypothetical protein